MLVLRRAFNNSPYEIFRFPAIRWVDHKRVDLTEEQKQLIEKTVSEGIYVYPSKQEGVKVYDGHISSYESLYINEILRSSPGTIISWVRQRKTDRIEESDIVFLYRAEDKAWCGLLSHEIVSFREMVIGMDPREWKLAVAISKSKADSDLISKIVKHMDKAIWEKSGSDLGMAEIYIQQLPKNEIENFISK